MEQYDIVIVGSGACGGWTAMALGQNGFKILLLEAGSNLEPSRVFRHRWPYQMDFRGAGQPGLLSKYFTNANEYNAAIMIDDRENPYTTAPGKPFRWSRSRILGGRTLHWARASDRMSDFEFKAASRDGYGDNWPISYRDIAPYYSRVEEFIGVSAAPAGLPQFPDGSFQPPMPLNCSETMFDAAARKLGLPSTPRRVAQLTRMQHNRPPCHFCGNCFNGCDVGAMFNTIAVTLPPALKTGNVSVRCDSVVSHVLTDGENRARGIRYIERYTGREVEVQSKIVVLAGSSLENTRLLLHSQAGGLANSSGVLGQYLMDQVGGRGVTGFLPPLKDTPIRNDDGKAGGLYLPNSRNLGKPAGSDKFIRGYGMSATGGAIMFPAFAPGMAGYGSGWKKQVKSLYPAYARVWMTGGEMLARRDNFIELDPSVKDKWGIPVLRIHCSHSDNDQRLYDDFFAHAQELFHAAGGEALEAKPGISVPGSLIHEVGTSRMGDNPKTSVLNSFCQTHDIPNLFVFGGGCFVTTGDKHPTLTMMALTARGCDYLTEQVRKRDI